MREWASLAAAAQLGAKTTLKDRTVVFERGDPAGHVYFLSAGAVELLQSTADGQSIVVKILVAPTLFGVIEVLGKEPTYLETVRVLGTASVHRIERLRFTELVRRNASAAYECTVDLSAAFCVAARFELRTLVQTEALLANLLLGYAELAHRPAGSAVTLQVRRTQADFAQAVGAAERSVNRILATWKDDEVISKRSGRYTLVKPEVLSRLAGDLRGSLVHRWAG